MDEETHALISHELARANQHTIRRIQRPEIFKNRLLLWSMEVNTTYEPIPDGASDRNVFEYEVEKYLQDIEDRQRVYQ